MKKLFIIALSLFLITQVFSQTQLTQYFLDGTFYNPGSVGSNDAVSSNIFGRQQWMGFADNTNNTITPFSLVFNMHAPIYSINSGAGINLIYDKLGFEKNVGLKLNYAYKFLMNNENGKMGVGIGISLLNKTIDFSQLIVEQPGDPLLNVNQSASAMSPNFDLGVYYKYGTNFDIGLSGINLIESPVKIGNVIYTQKRNLYLSSSYQITLIDSNEPLYLIPSVLVKSNLINAQVDLNARVEYNNLLWGGVSYRYQDAIALMAGVNLNGFRIGTAYDITVGSLSGSSKGSLEFFVGYNVKLNQNVKSTNNFNTRYL